MTNLPRVREQANTHYSEPPQDNEVDNESSILTEAGPREASLLLKCHLEILSTVL